ncbi:MAG TPA: rod shape-determining protein MreC [Noviherbaspirillum sp.]|nr:rod shape-determining protein MreC [Noviherbaspirillum sp.]
MEYSPPPLFKQGASARAKVVFFSLVALILLVADSRLRSLSVIRQAVGTALYPLQVVALLPRDAAYMVGDYFSSLSALKGENDKLKQQQVANAQTLQQVQQLTAENAQLRKLLAATERLPVKSVMSEILYDARDAFTRKIILDRGIKHGVAPGQPVIDDTGVVGQVTRVFPFTSEVTLLTDKDQAIPVQVVRSGLRSVAYGQGHSGALDLRFMPANADIKNGDVLVTSGIDGVYPAGLAVAKVVQVESKSTDAFARIVCQPLAGIDRNRQLLILLTEMNLLPRPEHEAVRDKAERKPGGDVVKEAPKEAPKELPKEPKEPPKEAPKTPGQEPKKEVVTTAVEQKAPVPVQKPAVEQKKTVPEPKLPAPTQKAPTP